MDYIMVQRELPESEGVAQRRGPFAANWPKSLHSNHRYLRVHFIWPRGAFHSWIANNTVKPHPSYDN